MWCDVRVLQVCHKEAPCHKVGQSKMREAIGAGTCWPMGCLLQVHGQPEACPRIRTQNCGTCTAFDERVQHSYHLAMAHACRSADRHPCTHAAASCLS